MWCAGLGAVVLGTAGLVFPTQSSSIGTLWGGDRSRLGYRVLGGGGAGSDTAEGGFFPSQGFGGLALQRDELVMTS